MNFLTVYLQMLFFSIGPLLGMGLLLCFVRQLFVRLVGTHAGHPLLLALFALGSPLREAAHVMAAVLCFQRIEEVRFLDLHVTDGELGFTERSYHPRNYLARFGNFLYAIAPVMLGLVVVLGVFLVCFGGVMEHFFLSLSSLEEMDGAVGYLHLAVGLLPAMFAYGEVSLFAKIVGALLLLFLCMGIFVSFSELLDGMFGLIVYAVIVAVPAGILLLFDARVQRAAMQSMREFATGVIALYIPVLLAATILLVFGALFFLVRKLGAVPSSSQAVEPYQGGEEEK